MSEKFCERCLHPKPDEPKNFSKCRDGQIICIDCKKKAKAQRELARYWAKKGAENRQVTYVERRQSKCEERTEKPCGSCSPNKPLPIGLFARRTLVTGEIVYRSDCKECIAKRSREQYRSKRLEEMRQAQKKVQIQAPSRRQIISLPRQVLGHDNCENYYKELGLIPFHVSAKVNEWVMPSAEWRVVFIYFSSLYALQVNRKTIGRFKSINAIFEPA